MPRESQAERVSQLVFFGTLILLGWLAYRIVQPFLVEIGWAVVLAICLNPVQSRLRPRLGPTRTALVLTALVLVLLILPAVLTSTTLFNEGSQVARQVQAQLEDKGGPAGVFHSAWHWARQRIPVLPAEEDVVERITASLGGVAGYLAERAGGILKGVASFIFSLGIMLAVLFFLLLDAPELSAALRRVMPFGREQNERLLLLTRDLVSTSVTATLTIALLQGILGGLAFAALGIHGAALWGTIMAILGLLPAVGAALVWIPAALGLILSGSPTKGIVLALVGVVVLSNVDNVVRPLLLSGSARMNTLVLLISLMGGVSAFGFIGIVLGPLVAAVFTAIVASYHPEPEGPAPIGGGETGAAPSGVPAPPEAAPAETSEGSTDG
jgi:predicted PurR-regulated permease PerM